MSSNSVSQVSVTAQLEFSYPVLGDSQDTAVLEDVHLRNDRIIQTAIDAVREQCRTCVKTRSTVITTSGTSRVSVDRTLLLAGLAFALGVLTGGLL